jgi:hypothetical protein
MVRTALSRRMKSYEFSTIQYLRAKKMSMKLFANDTGMGRSAGRT